MTDLEAMTVLFQQVDNSLEELREQHDKAGKVDDRERVERQQILNSQAHFVLAWGQLEADIDEVCRAAIERGILQQDWRQRRTWIVCKEDIGRLNFKQRLSLVLDRSTVEWSATLRYYNLRNQITQGDLGHTSIDFLTVVADFNYIRDSLLQYLQY